MERLGFARAGLTKVYSSMTYGPGARFMVMTRRLLSEQETEAPGRSAPEIVPTV
jgi:hypothetical protein